MEDKKMPLMGLLVVCGIALAWFLGVFDGSDSQVAELRQEVTQATETIRDVPSDQLRDQIRTQMSGLRERVEALPMEQRFQVAQPFIKMMIKRRLTEFDRIMDLPPAERNKELDRQIDERQQRLAALASNGGGGPQGSAGSQNQERRGFRDMSPEQRDEFRKKMLDMTTPETRAKMDAYRDALNDRREERGLEPIEGPPFGPPRR